jgi:hypothetical protein
VVPCGVRASIRHGCTVVCLDNKTTGTVRCDCCCCRTVSPNAGPPASSSGYLSTILSMQQIHSHVLVTAATAAITTTTDCDTVYAIASSLVVHSVPLCRPTVSIPPYTPTPRHSPHVILASSQCRANTVGDITPTPFRRLRYYHCRPTPGSSCPFQHPSSDFGQRLQWPF